MIRTNTSTVHPGQLEIEQGQKRNEKLRLQAKSGQGLSEIEVMKRKKDAESFISVNIKTISRKEIFKLFNVHFQRKYM